MIRRTLPDAGHPHRQNDIRPQRTVLLLDQSSSMSVDDYAPSRLHAAKTSAAEFVEKRAKVGSFDEVAIVSFSSTAQRECGLEEVRNIAAIRRAIDQIGFGDATAIGAALREAERVLLQDGQGNAITKFWHWLNDDPPPPYDPPPYPPHT